MVITNVRYFHGRIPYKMQYMLVVIHDMILLQIGLSSKIMIEGAC